MQTASEFVNEQIAGKQIQRSEVEEREGYVFGVRLFFTDGTSFEIQSELDYGIGGAVLNFGQQE